MHPTPSAPFGPPGSFFRDIVQANAARMGENRSPFSAFSGDRIGQFTNLNAPQLQQLFAQLGMYRQQRRQAPGLNLSSLLTALAHRR